MKMTAEHKAKMAAGRAAARARKHAMSDPQLASTPPAPEPAPASVIVNSPNLVSPQVDTSYAELGVEPPVLDPSKPETIPPNLFSGRTRRLEFFGDRPGFRRRYFNDEGSNVRDAVRTGWTFVKRTDVQLNAAVTPRNNDLGSNIRQAVGVQANGNALYAYLMEKPEWLCKEHDFGPGSREEYHQQLEKQIKDGTLGLKAGDRRYTKMDPEWGAGSTLPRISMDTKINR